MAHCYPYTFTDLCTDLDHLISDPQRNKHLKREVLCESIAGNACFLITVENNINSLQSDHAKIKSRSGCAVKGEKRCDHSGSVDQSCGSSCISSEKEANCNLLANKKIIIVTARVHPGEPNSSWMMKGFMEFITSENSVACV